MKNLILLIFLLVFSFFLTTEIVAEDVSNVPVSVYPRVCIERTYTQPNGVLKLSISCGDAAGTSIRIIDPKTGTIENYWEDSQWSQDVTAFCWSQSGKYLYISTSGIYGSGAIFELDLINRKLKVVLPKDYPPTAGTFTTTLLGYNSDSKTLKCKVEYFHREKRKPISEIIKISVK